MFLKITILPFLFFLPGFFTFAFLKKNNDNPKYSFKHIIFAMFLFSLVLSSGVAFTLATFRIFSMVNLLLILILYSLLFAFFSRERLSKVFDLKKIESFDIYSLAFILIIIVTLFIIIPPHQYFVGNKDPGNYLSTGINIAKTGSIVIENQFSEIPSSLKSWIPAFYIRGELLIPQFIHLWPTLIAIFYSLSSAKMVIYLTPIISILSLFSIYLTVEYLFTRKTALLSILLIALCFPQNWFSRYPTSEMLSQFLLFSGFLSFFIFLDTDEGFFGLISGASFGIGLLNRIDAILVFIPLFIVLAYLYIKKDLKIKNLYLSIPLALLTIQFLLYIYFVVIEYGKENFSLLYKPVYFIVALIILPLLLLGLNLSQSENVKKIIGRINTNYLKVFIVVMVMFLVFYGYAIRPHLTEVTTYAFNRTIKTLDEYNLFRLGLFITRTGILLGVLGWCLLLFRKIDKKNLFFLSTTFFFVFIFLYKSRISPQLIWAMRRYVPLVIPSFLIFASYFLISIHEFSKKLRERNQSIISYYSINIVVILLSIFLGFKMYSYSVPGINHVEFKNSYNFLSRVADNIPDDSVILFEAPTETPDIYSLFTGPLTFIWQKQVLPLRQGSINDIRLNQLLAYDSVSGKKLYYISRNNYQNPLFATFKLNKIMKTKLETKVMEETTLSRPVNIIPQMYPFYIYELKKGSNQSFFKYPIFLDIGIDDCGLEGTYRQEKEGKNNFRWTKNESRFYLPKPANETKKINIKLNISGYRPEGINSPIIKIYAGGVFISQIKTSNNFEIYEFNIDNPNIKINKLNLFELKIKTDTWNPNIDSKQPDIRDLGIKIDWIKVKVKNT